jgi:hypothetical protein
MVRAVQGTRLCPSRYAAEGEAASARAASEMSARRAGLPTVDHVELKEVDTPTWRFVKGEALGGKGGRAAQRD